MKIIIQLIILFLIFHTVRDFMQLIGLHNFFTETGHAQGIENSNKLLSLIGLKYEPWTEIPMILVELFLIKNLAKLQK